MNNRSGDTTALRSSKSANGGRALPIINAVVWASKRTLMSFLFYPSACSCKKTICNWKHLPSPSTLWFL
ncbi:hypothetical protein IMY05_007G0087400 [Salix suchowensis]|nr:hypothetical protein IMY05_007G0087400 [Salix suchowensis]